SASAPSTEQSQPAAAPAAQQPEKQTEQQSAGSAPAAGTELEDALRGLIAEHLKMPEQELDDETPLSEYGFDSITITSFSHALNQRYGVSLGATVLYEAPTVSALADYLRQEQPALVKALTQADGSQQQQKADSAPQPAAAQQPEKQTEQQPPASTPSK